ncbi:MAG TPA: hypothetical protein VGS20_07420 [Candidatus Acidoferrales bacterium]|nr:hypothetical protein [Candidatus Acidoferrales bacterium]
MSKYSSRLFLFAWLLASALAFAQRPATAPPPGSAAAPASPAQAEFLRAADDVLAQMSEILGLPVLHPLKKSIESKAEIRAYLVKEQQEDKEPAKRYADKKALEALGLIPPNFDLDGFLLDLLTQQIAGLYDPKAQEFYIADWIPVSEQRIVMAHELTHALDDQHFHIDAWSKAARPDDDAEAAREAVLEGSAVVAMLDYELHGMGRSVRDMPDIAPLTQAVIGDASSSPDFAKAPPYLRDSLLFPYLDGAVFTQQVLKAGAGWTDFQKVFERPPASTQQLMQPQLYLEDKSPPPVALPDLKRLLGSRWRLLDQNVAGEFGLKEALKQYLGQTRAAALAPEWWGDRYAILEDKKTKSSLLLFLLRLDSQADAARYFEAYATLLDKKHAGHQPAFTAGEFLRFQSAEGGVYFECHDAECFSMEGADRAAFDRVTEAMGWPPAPHASGGQARGSPARQGAGRPSRVALRPR